MYSNSICTCSMTGSCMQLKIKLLGTYHWTNSLFVSKPAEQSMHYVYCTVCRVCTAWKRSSDRCIECWVLWKILKALPVDFSPGFTVSVLSVLGKWKVWHDQFRWGGIGEAWTLLSTLSRLSCLWNFKSCSHHLFWVTITFHYSPEQYFTTNLQHLHACVQYQSSCGVV